MSYRRTQISRGLLDRGFHVEPFEDVSELLHRWPRAGTILAHDEGETLSALTGHMGRTGSWLPVVAFAEAPRPRQVVQAVRDGVVDYIGWPFDGTELAEALKTAQESRDKLANIKLRQAMARSRIERLSAREREVLGYLASGLPNGLIAKQLGTSSRTVEVQRASMLRKIGAKHTSEAIRLAIEASLLH